VNRFRHMEQENFLLGYFVLVLVIKAGCHLTYGSGPVVRGVEGLLEPEGNAIQRAFTTNGQYFTYTLLGIIS
jgi:hypothetical protein